MALSYVCDIARHCMHSAANMSRQSVTCCGILGHITPWADIALRVIVYYSVGLHGMTLYGMVSHGLVWMV